ncbi:MAG: IPT/TIG domain-containing protein [Bryobacteraceae bacterium]
MAAGSATTTFGATSGTIASNQTATVTATYNSTSATAGISLSAPPVVSGVSPNSGSTAGGTAVTITGTNFAAGATVMFGGLAATGVVVENSTTITASTPAGNAGAVTVTVTNPGAQSGNLAAGFTFVVPPVTTIAYVQGNYATPQTPETTVKVTYTTAQAAGDLNVVAAGWNDSKAVVSAVTDSKGNTYVRAVGPTVQSGYASQSIYYAKNIVSAAAGTNAVTVTFASAATSADIRIVEYSGADPGNPVDVAVASSGTSATSSSGAVTTTNATDLLFGANLVQTSTTGPCGGFTKRLLTTPDGDIAEDRMLAATGSYSATGPLSPSGPWIMQMVAFRTASGGTALPTVSGVSPNGGSTAGGTAVTITGTGFAAGAAVKFGATAAANIVVVSGTTITATTPAGSAGAVTVTVTVNGQSGSLANGFSYTLPSTVSSVSPNSGSTAGGTAVTITGANFAAGATAAFGGTAATNVVVVSGTEITATTPAGSAGAVTVTATNPGAQSGSLANGFTYVMETTATPTLVSHLSESNSRSSAVSSSPWQFYFHLADPATSGNAIIVACQFQGEAALAITDNKSDSYNNAEIYYNLATNQSIVIAESFNVTAGAYNLTATWNAETSHFQCVSSQIANVTAADGLGIGNEGSGTSVTAGSLTPTVTGDLVYQVAASLGGTLTQASFTAGSQSNVTWNLESADLRDGMAVQAGVYSSAAAIDPAMTLGTSAAWISAAVLLKSGAAGGVPAGMRVAYEIHENIPDTTAAGGTGSGWTNPMTLQIPCVAGAAIAAMMDGGGTGAASTISGIADSNGNTWSQIALYTYNGGSVYAQAYYAKNATCSSSTLTLTIAFTANTDDNTIVFYVIPGASANPLDTYSGGGQDVTSNSSTMTPSYTLTPTGSNDLVLAEENWYYNTATGAAAANWLFDSGYYSGITLDGPQPVDENGGWMHYYASSTSSLSFTYNLLSSTDATGPSSGMAVAFK